jgi:ribose transport system substrate-binding protein
MKIPHTLKTPFCLLVGAALVMPLRAAEKELKSVAVTVGDLGNPFFVQIAHGAEAKAKEINPKVKFGALSSNYDVNKQTNDVDNLISSGTTLLLLESAKFRGQNVIGIKMPNAPKR